MDFASWLAANQYDAEKLTDSQRKHLEAAWKAETQPPAPPEPKPQAKPEPSPSCLEDQLSAFEAEAERKAAIDEMVAKWAANNTNDASRIRQARELRDLAKADSKVSVKDFQLTLLRFDRTIGPMALTPKAQAISSDVVEAAVCQTFKLSNIDKHFSEQTLEMAHKKFRRGMSLKRLVLMGARQNGFTGDDADWYTACRFAMRPPSEEYGMSSDVTVSTGVQVPGILSNTANKFLAMNFMNVDQSWRGIAKIRPVSDFKQITTYRMGGNNTFLRVPPGGEIKHGALSETSYTNQAKTYGRLLGISREDYINDDLGAFISVTAELGRGAADGLNNIFWAAFLNDSTFFPTDKSKLNYDDGATDSVLSLAGLDNAEAIFAVQTKADGTPLGATPKILLVPSALKNSALTFMTAQDLVVGTTAATGVNKNVFAGRYTVVASPFLQRTSLNDENGVSQTVTGSSTAWYLLCDPADIPVIEVVFLDGKDTPTVETDQFEFDRLGLATRAYFDFGIALQEYRGGIKLKGAA